MFLNTSFRTFCQVNHNKKYISKLFYTGILEEPGKISGRALGYGLDYRGFDSRQVLGIFLFIITSR
jgi:hypothetical protein